jgi:hypothetical protein
MINFLLTTIKHTFTPSQHTITKNVINGVYKGVTTVELDMLAAETAASLATEHPDYAVLAARIVVSNLHKETKKVGFRLRVPFIIRFSRWW